jgi:uncharacterized RDD family membrane protein YckC
MSSFERSSYSDQLNIDTPEQVELQYNIAGVGSRFVAALLDYLIQLVCYLVEILLFVLIASGAAATHTDSAMDTAAKWVVAILIFLNFAFFVGYFALFEAYWRGQTPGKRVMKLRVLKDSGRQITLFEALARNLIRVIDYLPSWYLVGVVTMLCNKGNKRLGDLAAGTIVVHVPIAALGTGAGGAGAVGQTGGRDVSCRCGGEAERAGPDRDRGVLRADAGPSDGDAGGSCVSHDGADGREDERACSGGKSGAGSGGDCVPDARQRAGVLGHRAFWGDIPPPWGVSI